MYMYVYVYYDITGVGVMTVYTEDVDAGHNRTVVYSLKQVPMFGQHKIFSIDRNTGLISTNYAEALDREREAVYRDVIVQARDNGIPTPLFCKPSLYILASTYCIQSSSLLSHRHRDNRSD